MKRMIAVPRPDWKQKVEKLGLLWHTTENGPYWDESAYYQFTAQQVDTIEAATEELYGLFLAAGEHVVKNQLYDQFGIPSWAWPLIEKTWNSEPPALNYGRFDLGYDGVNPPKLFEFNCDTPTSLLETAVVQWDWKEDVLPHADQFNSLDDRLFEKWRELNDYLPSGTVHFTHVNDEIGEDTLNASYMMDVARRAGLNVQGVFIQDIGWDKDFLAFVDLEGLKINTLFHLYPWECLAKEEFAPHIAATQYSMVWIEPIWKMIWSNKAILPILWQLFPNHPNLLGAWFGQPKHNKWIRKPKLSREGANIKIQTESISLETGGQYGQEGFIFQDVYTLPCFEGHYPVVGSWIVDGAACGMGIREGGLITDNTSRFIPHVFQ